MSNHYKKKRDNAIINCVLFAVLMIVLFPVIPISFIFILILYFTEVKGRYSIFSSLGVAIFLFIFAQNIFEKFLIEFLKVISFNLQTMSHFNIIENITAYSNYSLSSWFIMLLISLLIAGYFMEQITKQKQIENAGVNSFDVSVQKINENMNNNSHIKTDKKESTFLGINKSKKEVYCEDNAKHIFVCGTTGSGKTVALSNFIKSGVEKDYGMLIVDGKGDMDENSILSITRNLCNQYNKKLYVVNMNTPEKSCKYNPFKDSNETVCMDMIINMTDWSEEHYKFNVERYIQALVKLLKNNNEILSLDKIVSYMAEDNFIALSKKAKDENSISKEQHIKNIDIAKASGKIATDAEARFSTIVESKVGCIFDENGLDIYTAIKEKAIILFVLNPLEYPETTKSLGRLVLVDGKQAVSKLFGNLNRTFYIFDEINVYLSHVLVDLINKSRSANVTSILSTQSLADLEIVAGEAFKQQIIENCNNYIVLRQNSFKSAEEWAKTIGTVERMKMTYKVTDTESTGSGSARSTREFLIHPDEIKSQQMGQAVFLSKDTGKLERVKIYKPF